MMSPKARDTTTGSSPLGRSLLRAVAALALLMLAAGLRLGLPADYAAWGWLCLMPPVVMAFVRGGTAAGAVVATVALLAEVGLAAGGDDLVGDSVVAGAFVASATACAYALVALRSLSRASAQLDRSCQQLAEMVAVQWDVKLPAASPQAATASAVPDAPAVAPVNVDAAPALPARAPEARSDAAPALHHDLLTGLPDRHLLAVRLGETLPVALHQRRLLAVCCLGIDGIDAVRSAHGDAAADLAFRLVAERVQDCMRGNDIVARVGEDSLVVVLSQLADHASCQESLDRVFDLVQMRIPLGHDRSAQVAVTPGLAFCPDDDTQAEPLIERACASMQRARAAARGRSTPVASRIG